MQEKREEETSFEEQLSAFDEDEGKQLSFDMDSDMHSHGDADEDAPNSSLPTDTDYDGEDHIDEYIESDIAEESLSDEDEEIQENIFDENEEQLAFDFDDGKEEEELLKKKLAEKQAKKLAAKKYDPKNPRRCDTLFDFVELIVYSLVIVLVLTTFFFKHSVVDGDSMQNTLHDGEHLIITNLFYTPQRGDVIVCEDYSTAVPKPIVKRVIGVAGDVIEITAEGVWRNGELLYESYVYTDGFEYDYNCEFVFYEPVVVPEGKIYVMGDHRNKSTDSRVLGPIDEDSVIGKVVLRFYPFDKFGVINGKES